MINNIMKLLAGAAFGAAVVYLIMNSSVTVQSLMYGMVS